MMTRPAGEVLNGLQILDLPPGWIAIDSVVLLKTLDEDGDVQWVSRFTKSLGDFEALGALTAAQAVLTREIASRFEDDPDDGDAGGMRSEDD